MNNIIINLPDKVSQLSPENRRWQRNNFFYGVATPNRNGLLSPKQPVLIFPNFSIFMHPLNLFGFSVNENDVREGSPCILQM